MKKNKFTSLLPLIIGSSLAIGVFVGGKLNFSKGPTALFSINSKKDKLNKLIDFIDREYVDEVNTDSIVDVTVNNILEKLDPHSVYIPNDVLQSETEKMKGDFVGIGVSFYMYKDSLAIIKPMEDGPSKAVGIKPGDRILAADGDTLFGKNIPSSKIIEKLKGSRNTSVDLNLYRKSDSSYFKVAVTRKDVAIKSVEASYMLNETMGYIKIIRFAESTFKEFKAALTKLQAAGMKNLTLDLRDNPGGYLGIAEQIADEFLEEDKLILFTKNKKGDIEETYATDEGDFEEGNIFVLINEQSASASEIIAGALQDNDKGTIIGRRSFGKGLVQREMKLGDGSAVRLTISRYYTPTGRSIQKSYKKGTKDYYHEFQNRWRSGELVSFDSIKVADSLKFTTPKGKVVYGGGGIIPDVFVPINERGEEDIELLEKSGFLGFYIFEHLDQDRTKYNYLNKEEFIHNFKSDDFMFYDFQKYCLDPQRNLRLDFETYEDKIKLYLKATLASQIYDENTAKMLLNQDDTMIKKALELEHISQN